MYDNINNNNCFNYTIQENNKSVKQILIENLNFSRRLTVRLEKNEKVYLNNKPVRLRKRVYYGDIITVLFDDDEKDEYEPVDIPLNILYEDSSFLIVDKPPFMVVHPTLSHFNDTLANGIRYYFDKKDIKSKIRLVNRLDMNTSGIVIIAKSSYVHNEMSKQMKDNIIEKYYYAICEGTILEDKATINAPIARLKEDDIVRVVDSSGKECITHFEVKERFNEMTLVRIKLETGRTHQIRVHMKHLRHPLVGDTLYNRKSELISRQALHCSEMSFVHPFTKEKIIVKANLPQDFLNILS